MNDAKLNTVTVTRTALIAAITTKAEANQAAYDAAVKEAEANDLSKAMDAAIEKAFGKDGLSGPGYAAGYRKQDAESYKNSFLNNLGQKKAGTIAKPRLFEQELAILTLATDTELVLPIGHNLLTVL